MSDSAGEKTEQPTDKKLRDARKKGQIAQSQDVNKLFVTAFGFEVILLTADTMLENLLQLISLPFGMAGDEFIFSSTFLIKESLMFWFKTILPILGIVILGRYIASFVQYGVLFAPESLKLKLDKFSPVANAKNIFSQKNLVEFLGNLLKALVLVSTVYWCVKLYLPEILLLSTTNLETSIAFSLDLFSFLLHIVLLCFLLIATFDFVMQKSIFIKSMKMTKDEVFREYKQSEGDPAIKQERKAFGHKLIYGDGGNIKKTMVDTDAVVVNPTHFAIALEYKPGKTKLPILLAKGVDDRAKEIVQYAKENNIPVIRYVSLARNLFRTGKEGKYIPRESLQQMASVFIAIREAKEAGKTDMFMTAELRDPH